MAQITPQRDNPVSTPTGMECQHGNEVPGYCASCEDLFSPEPTGAVVPFGRYNLDGSLPLPQFDSDSIGAELLVTPSGLYVICQRYQEEDDNEQESITVSLTPLRGASGMKRAEEFVLLIDDDYDAVSLQADAVYAGFVDRVLPD